MEPLAAPDAWLPFPKLDSSAPARTPGRWQATEKLHGAQLGIWVTPGAVRLSKRRELLTEATLPGFFNAHLLLPELSVRARAAFEALKARAPGLQSLTLYAELVGGYYPGVGGSEDAAIQTGVWYAPEYLVVPFAARALLPGPGWLAPGELRSLAALAGFPPVPLLGEGSFHTLDALPREFPSRLAASLGLPLLPGNLAEGFVLAPLARSIEPPTWVKRKAPHFAEDEAYAGARPQLPRLELPPLLAAEAAQLLTPTRVSSARAKLGPLAPAELAIEVARDVAAELGDASLAPLLLPAARALTQPPGSSPR